MIEAIENFELAVETLTDMVEDLDVPPENVRDILSTMSCWVMCYGDTAIGIGAIEMHSSFGSPHVYVKSEFRNLGNGQEIIKKLEEKALGMGLIKMIGLTPIENEPAKKMMLDSGYEHLLTLDSVFVTIKEF